MWKIVSCRVVDPNGEQRGWAPLHASPPPISPHFVPTNDLARVLFLYFVSPACFCLPTIMRSFQGEGGGRGRRARRETTLPSLPPHPCFLARKNIFVLLNRCSLNDKWLATANPSATTISPRTLTWCLPISIASTSFFYDFQPERIRLRCFRPLQFGERIPVNGRAKFRNFSINLSRIHFRGKEIKREKEISGIYMEYLEYFRRFAGRTNERNIFYTRCVLQFL